MAGDFRFSVKKDIKKLIVNGDGDRFNVIVKSDEVSTDDHGEYITLDREDLMDLYKGIGKVLYRGGDYTPVTLTSVDSV